MYNKRRVGNEQETVALHYLESQGYTILERNFYTRGGEADIIALDKDVLCFIEVKYRSTPVFGSALEAVTIPKQKRIIKLAKFYIMKHTKYSNSSVRFDVLAIDGPYINLIKAAFDAY